ncbi:MAG: ATP-binding cassette domain-containing protein [Sediminibacterium sp.]|jgi:ABC-2 type transport system ATP-binding protein|nr:ATP-binding cassette domain-containing protein [Sediminibacterium sp.]
MSAISIKGLKKRYASHPALQGVDLAVQPGEIYGLLGQNGAGKTTTIQILLGFQSPDEGTVSLLGKTPGKDRSLTKDVAYIPENVSLYPYLNGIENLQYFSRLANINVTKNEAENLLIKCGLAANAHFRLTSTYSKGMRQKIGIAIALAKSAQIFLLDEPSSGLDPLASNELTQLLRELAANGKSILMASHDIFRIRETADKIGILHRGKILKELHSADVSASDIESIYLEYMKM